MSDVKEIGEFDHGKHRGVDDHQPQLDLAATIDDAEHAIKEGVDRNQEQETAFDQQHHRLQVPIAELEAVVTFFGDKFGGDQHQDLDEGRDQREKTIEQDGLGT